MATEIPNSLNCYGSVVGASGAKGSGAGFSPSRSGAGVYVIQLDQPVNAAQCAMVASLRGASGMIEVEHTDDAHKTVKTFDATGAAADRNFDFLLQNCPNS